MRDELNEILCELQAKKFADVQSIELLIEYGFVLNQHIARTGQLMSEAKEILHNKSRDAYKLVWEAPKAVAAKLSPMLLKDYISHCCAEESATYELAERANKACTHANSLIITAISALKNERFASNVTGSVMPNVQPQFKRA